MDSRAFTAAAPWRIADDSEITIGLSDPGLLGSSRHYLMFDFYPVHAPAHPGRHIGRWKLPLRRVTKPSIKLRFTKGRLVISGGSWWSPGLEPEWRGSMPAVGMCTMNVSLWGEASGGASKLAEQTSTHTLGKPGADLPLTMLTFYVTRRCNLRCDMCLRELLDPAGDVDATPAVVDAVLEASPLLWSVLLHGDGEPLLHPRLASILGSLKSRMRAGGKVGLLTNGMGMNFEKMRELTDLGLDWLSFSLDGSSKDTVERIRRGSDFDRIVANARRAVEYGKRTRPGGIRYSIQCTLRRSNVGELPDLVRLAGELGVDNVSLAHRIRYETGKYEALGEETLASRYEEAGRIGRRLGVTITAQPLKPPEPERCHFVEELRVYVSGIATLCCFRVPGNPEQPMHPLGNVKDTPLLEIWGGGVCRDLRARVGSGEFSGPCRTCDARRWGCYSPL
jgi:MoaA/NifB/PqqE/SkfB family radical SAM enzyme